jgi:hypothetical protein
MAKVKFQTTKIGEVILEATTQPDGQTLIDSWSLNQLAQSKEMRELGFEVVDYSFPFINAGSATCILKCRDKDGFLPMAIGEANKGNLTNEISRSLPHTMAYKRALDRAIIEYLGIGDGDRKRLYSDTEIEVEDVIAPVEEIPYSETELPEIPEEVTTVSEEVVEEPQEEAKKPNKKEEILAYKIKIGTQKGKTIESLLDNGSLIQTLANPKEEGGKTKYVVWLIENNPTRQELIELKDNLLKLKEIEEKEGK